MNSRPLRACTLALATLAAAVLPAAAQQWVSCDPSWFGGRRELRVTT
jgi:hypothetical protein